MQENLVIVESPAKAKTIEKFLGKDFVVTSSFGHIRDLAKKDFGIDIENNYEPQYIVPTDKKKVVSELKKRAKDAQVVWLASDEDREGEAIAWHLYEVLGLKKKETKRIVFHEITKSAILKAIETPRTIDKNLVDAQQARRVLDRLVGFELSPILWRKVKPSLSAGRVQSVAVRLLVERERAIYNFISESAFRVSALFNVPGKDGEMVELKAELSKRYAILEKAQQFLEGCKGAEYTISDLVTKPGKKSPPAPFTTSTLQQEASRKLGFSVSQTMTLAQRLYEAGRITYMRTDSVNLSDLAVATSKAEIERMAGPEYVHTRQFKTKSKGAQEAHEAIRPTYMDKHTVEGSDQEQRLYELIWKRTIASQMADAKLEKTTVTIDISGESQSFVATGEVLKFDGFLKVYMESSDDESEGEKEEKGLLPPLNVNDILDLKEIQAVERFSQRPARFTEASLVRKLEELGIGRPSTYAPTISTIQNRGYVLKEEREGKERKFQVLILKDDQVKAYERTEITGAERNKLFPTDIGMVVNDFLHKHFPEIMDFNFTAKVEKEFDDIADGNQEWTHTIDGFYKPFHKQVEVTLETSERNSGERILGNDPKTGKVISVRIGKYGPMAQLGSSEEEEKPQYAGLRKGQHLEIITLEEAIDLFKLPRGLGEYEEKKVTVGIGRFGPYVRHDSKFVSLKKDVDDPMTIDLPRAIELIEEKREKDRQKFIKSFDEDPEIQVLNGRWGAYISYQKKNYKLPKEKKENAKELTYEECKKIIEEGGTSKGTKKKASSRKK